MGQTPTARHDHSYWRTLFAAVHDIASSLDPDEVLNRLVRRVAAAMDVKAATLRLLEADGDVLSPRTTFGLSEAYLKKGPVDVKHSPLDRATLKGEPVWVEDVRRDSRFQYPEAAEREGLVSALCVPVTLHDEIIGVLRVYSDQRREFDREEVEFLSALAELGALAIENARLHEELRRDYNLTVDAIWGVESLKD